MRFVAAVCALALLGAAVLAGASAGAGDPERGREIMRLSNLSYYYAGHDMRAKITMELGVGREVKRQRTMTVIRLNTDRAGEQRYLLYFHKPGDVRRMTCMVLKHPQTADERWMYVPLRGQVLRVQASDRSSFLGSDFVREEFSGRDVDADRHSLLREEILRGRPCYVVQSVPNVVDDFTRAISWIDRETHLPVRQEYYDERGALSRIFTGGRIERIRSLKNPGTLYPTLMERTVTDAGARRWTRVVLDSVSYDLGLRVEDFSDAHMRAQISDWLPSPGSPEEAAPKRKEQ